MSIVTGYFDEGVFENMGWGDSNSELPLGAAGIVVRDENGRSVIFDSGYGKSSPYEVYDLCEPDKRNEPCRLLFGDDELLIKMRVSCASMAAFIDNRSGLFIKRF